MLFGRERSPDGGTNRRDATPREKTEAPNRRFYSPTNLVLVEGWKARNITRNRRNLPGSYQTAEFVLFTRPLARKARRISFQILYTRTGVVNHDTLFRLQKTGFE